MNIQKPDGQQAPDEEAVIRPEDHVEFFNPWEEQFKRDLNSDERSFDF